MIGKILYSEDLNIYVRTTKASNKSCGSCVFTSNNCGVIVKDKIFDICINTQIIFKRTKL